MKKLCLVSNEAVLTGIYCIFRRVAELFMFDFEISGIHLDEEKVIFCYNTCIEIFMTPKDQITIHAGYEMWFWASLSSEKPFVFCWEFGVYQKRWIFSILSHFHGGLFLMLFQMLVGCSLYEVCLSSWSFLCWLQLYLKNVLML